MRYKQIDLGNGAKYLRLWRAGHTQQIYQIIILNDKGKDGKLYLHVWH